MKNEESMTDSQLSQPQDEESSNVPIIPSATGQYPDPVWIDNSNSATQVKALTEEAHPPSATGQYPNPVWIDGGKISIQADNAGTSLSVPEKTTLIPLDNQAMYQIIRTVARFESGDELYTAVNTSEVNTYGVRIGLVGFKQTTGELGNLLTIMKRRDPILFSEVFYPHSEELLEKTTSESVETRLQPVGNKELWHMDWQSRFRQAGDMAVFQAAQNETAIEHQFRPMLSKAAELGIHIGSGLAIMYDRVVALGLEEGLRWVSENTGPSADEDKRLLHILAAAPEKDKERLSQLHNSNNFSDVSYQF